MANFSSSRHTGQFPSSPPLVFDLIRWLALSGRDAESDTPPEVVPTNTGVTTRLNLAQIQLRPLDVWRVCATKSRGGGEASDHTCLRFAEEKVVAHKDCENGQDQSHPNLVSDSQEEGGFGRDRRLCHCLHHPFEPPDEVFRPRTAKKSNETELSRLALDI